MIDHFLCLKQINIQCPITGADGAACADYAEIAPVNYFLHGLFKQVDLTLSDTVVSSSVCENNELFQRLAMYT